MTTRTYRFTIKLFGLQEFDDTIANLLFECGCDDGLLWARNKQVYMDFDRVATSFGKAVGTAIDDIESAGYQCELVTGATTHGPLDVPGPCGPDCTGYGTACCPKRLATCGDVICRICNPRNKL